jgi:3,4-dihydroxy 2-butanone 4-phosphate synthase / GTP cyclohydrolase II
MHTLAPQDVNNFSSIEQAISYIKQGKMVILTDNKDRENEGDLVFAASECTPEKINFMTKKARGLICLSLDENTIKRLQLPMMVEQSKNHTPFETAFTVSIEAKEGVTTGISAQDRSHTILTAIADNSSAKDIVVPGHIFPLKAKKGGVLERTGHTEGSVDLCKLAEKKSAAVICEILKEDGSMAREQDLKKLSKEYQIPIVSINDIIKYRLRGETLIKEIKQETTQTSYGKFTSHWFQSTIDNSYHVALVKGGPFNNNTTVEVRVHKQNCFTDVFASELNDSNNKASSRKMINYGLSLLKNHSHAVFIYIKDSKGLSPFAPAMDPKAYGVGAQILKHLQIRQMNLHQSQKKDYSSLESFGIKIKSIKII